MKRTITVDGRRFLHPSEMPNYDPSTGGYRGGDPDANKKDKEDELRKVERFFDRMRTLSCKRTTGSKA